MARRRAGTAIRRSWDARRIGRALAHQGADLRHWVSYATVAAVDESGNIDLTNPSAIVITPGGIDVDVVLEPSGYPMTCRYGQAAAGFFICGPIKVGDQVVVDIPDGDPSMVGKIVSVTSAPDGSVVPVGDDGLPIFKNDRLLIMAKGVPVDVRTDGGAQMLLNPDGSVAISAGGGQNTTFNGGSRGVARVGDKTKRTLSSTDITNIIASAVAAGLVIAGSGGPPPKPVPLNQDETGISEIAEGSGTVLAGD